MFFIITITFTFAFIGKGQECAPDCNQYLIGNSNCDTPCNNINCDYDGGDCLTNNTVLASMETCNIPECSNVFFVDCAFYESYTDKWCSFSDDDDSNPDICCSKLQTDCCAYNNSVIIPLSITFFVAFFFFIYGCITAYGKCCAE